MMRVVGLWVHLLSACIPVFAQVDTAYVYNTSTPYGTLDIRIAKSPTRYYYLQEDVTFSFRESSPGVKTNTFKDMTNWDSSPYKEGNLRERNGSQDYFIMNYRFLMPNDYDPSYEPGYPIIIMLHGYGERANCWDRSCYWSTPSWNPNSNSPPAPTDEGHSLLNNDHNLLHGGRQHLSAVNLAGSKRPDDPALHPRAFPGFVLFPQSLNGWHQSPRVEEAIKLLRLIIRKYNIDKNRVYIHALSNGGGGLYQAIKRAPWLFAAALPMSAVSHSGAIHDGVIGEVSKIPLWAFQGAKDMGPTPEETYQTIKALRDAGANVRYSLYPHLGHGTWNTAYNEPDFFSWILSRRKTNPHVKYGVPAICGTNGVGAKLEFSKGFAAYQWEKDGAIVQGATSSEYVVNTPGTVRGRFSRKPDPAEGDWEPWSDPVTVTEMKPVKPLIESLSTTHLRGPGLPASTTNNTAMLRSGQEADLYFWYKDGIPLDFPGTSVEDTLRTIRLVSHNTSANGFYTLETSYSHCPSPTSDPVYLFFNNSAPQNIALDPGEVGFRGSVVGDGVFLTWNDRLSTEMGYEVWRRKSGAPQFVFVGRAGKDAISMYDGPLEPLTTYEYKLRAVNNSGASNYIPSNDLNVNYTITTGGDHEAPAAPQDLKMIFNTISSFTLTWRHAIDNTGIREYIIYYGDKSVSTDSMINTFTIGGLPESREFPVTVRAVDFAGRLSPPSNQIIATTFMLGLNYKHSTGGWEDLDDPRMVATWEDPEFQGNVANITLAPRTQEDFFNFQFTGYLDIGASGNYQFNLKSDDGSRLILDNAVLIDNDGLHGNSAKVSDTIFLAQGPHPIEIQYFEYSGGNNIALTMKGPDSLDGAFVKIPDSLFRSARYVAGTAPSLPGALDARSAGMQRIDITWQSGSTVEVYRAGASNGPYSIIGRTDAQAFADTVGLMPSTLYYYKVRAISNAGASALTGAVSALTGVDNVPPATPAGPEVQTSSHTHIAVTWDPSTDNVGVTGYEVFIDGILNGTTPVPAFMITDLMPNTSYVITIRAFDASQNRSAPSQGAAVTTKSTATYYSSATGSLNELSSWGQNPDGTGAMPTSFSGDGQYFIIANRTETHLGGSWSVTGSASKVILSQGVTLTVEESFTAGLDLQDGSSLKLDHADIPDLVRISPLSTVYFNAPSSIPSNVYGHVILGNNAPVKAFGVGTTTILGDLTAADGVVIKGASGNGTTLSIAGDLIIQGGSGPIASDNRVNVDFTDSVSHTLSAGGNVYASRLGVGSNAEVHIIADDAVPIINVGSVNGGGLVLGSGSLFNMDSATLRIGHHGITASEGGTGLIRVNGGNIFVRSDSPAALRMYFDSNGHTVDTLSIDVAASLSVENPLLITRVLEIKNGTLDAGGNITLVSNAAASARIAAIEGTGRIAGDVKVQQFLAPLGDSWREMSTSVSGVTVADWQDFFPITGSFAGASGGQSDPSMFVSEGAGLTPYPFAGTSNQAPIGKGKGYYTRIRETNAITIEVAGNPFQGNVSFDLSTAGASSGGWNLLGNPYASPVAWNSDPHAWTGSGVSRVIAVRETAVIEGQTVGHYRYFDPVLGPATLKKGQAFWAWAYGEAPALTITENAKTSAATDYPRENGDANYMVITLQRGPRHDQAWIVFDAHASDGFDPALDGRKLPNEGLFNLSTTAVGETDLAVNHLPNGFCSKTVSLNVQNTGPGDYTFNFSGLETLADMGVVTLTDHFRGSAIKISSDPVTFTVTDDPQSFGPSRFSLSFERYVLDTSSPHVTAADVCADDPAVVQVTGSRSGVDYVAVDAEGRHVSDVVAGGAENIFLTISDSALAVGPNQFRIQAGYKGCSSAYLDARAEFTYTLAFEIQVEPEVSVCAGDAAIIQASGVPAGGSYHWFDEHQNSIDSVFGSTLVTAPVIHEEVFYVAGVLPNGCESERHSVHIFPDSLAVPVITNINDTLVTQVEATFQWKKDGQIIEGATRAYYVPETTGEYSVLAFKGGCVRESERYAFVVCVIDPSGPVATAGNSCGDDPVPVTIDHSQEHIQYFAIDAAGETVSDTLTGDGGTIVLAVHAAALDSGMNELRVVAHQPGCSDQMLGSVVNFIHTPFPRPTISLLDGVLVTDSTGAIQWKRDGNVLSGENGHAYTPEESGSYTVSVQVGDCTVESYPVEFVVTSVDEGQEFRLSLFPVPASPHNLTVSLRSPDPGDVFIRVLDLAGRTVYMRHIAYRDLSTGISLQPDSGPLQDGIYVIIASQGARQARGKFIIAD